MTPRKFRDPCANYCFLVTVYLFFTDSHYYFSTFLLHINVFWLFLIIDLLSLDDVFLVFVITLLCYSGVYYYFWLLITVNFLITWFCFSTTDAHTLLIFLLCSTSFQLLLVSIYFMLMFNTFLFLMITVFLLIIIVFSTD